MSTSTRAGGIDWEVRCREMVLAHRAADASREELGDRWTRRASRFLKMTREPSREGLFEVLGPLLRATDTVLDIGAGTGRHVVDLVGRAARVIALEPSAAMRAGMEEVIRERALRDVTVLADPWPAELEGGCDLAFSAHVLYGSEEPAPFLHAMTRASRRVCALYLAPTPPVCALDSIWEHVHGRSRPHPPGALEIFALLWQLGARPELVRVPNSERTMTYRDDPEDLAELAARLGLDGEVATLARVRASLEARATRTTHPQGGVAWAVGSAGPNLLITWDGARAP